MPKFCAGLMILFSASPKAAAVLNAHHRMFGVSEVAEARAPRAFEIFWHVAAAVPAEQSRYRRVGVDNDEWQTAPCQYAPDRSGETDEVAHVAAIDQLRARNDAAHQARAEDERIGALGRDAPQADAAVRGVGRQHLLIARVEAHVRLAVRLEHLGLRSAEQSVEHRHGDEDAVAIVGKALRFD